MLRPSTSFVRITGFVLITILALAGISACTSIMAEPSPDQMLNLTVSGISAVDRIGFSGRTSTRLPSGMQSEGYAFEGEVVDHSKLSLKAAAPQGGTKMNRLHAESGMNTAEADSLNPVIILESLLKTKKKVAVDSSHSSGKQIMLQIDVDGAKAKQAAAAKFRNDFKRTAAEALARKNAGNSKVRLALNKEIARSKAELESMLRSLSVQSSYALRIDKSRYLPQSLQETTMLHYTSNGEKRAEQRITDYAFGSFSGK